MKTHLLKIMSLLVLLSLLLASKPAITLAQVDGSQAPPSVPPGNGARIDRHPGSGDSLKSRLQSRQAERRLDPAGSQPSDQAAPQAIEDTGGPDYFGYTWNNSVAINWIDATNGINTGMSGDSWGKVTGPVQLPFEFRFYEDKYSLVWISASGYLSLSDNWYWPYQQHPFPNTNIPNAVIAPFWTVTYLQNSAGNGSVFYKSGGTAPNRYFVVEWYNVAGGTISDPTGGDESYRFEVILYENGDILFQYQNMVYNDYRYYASIGIEDKDGIGLGYMDWDSYWSRLPASNSAVRFYRPAAAARVNIKPAYFGAFGAPGGQAEMWIPIRNTGDLGPDVFNLSASSSWPVSFYAADGLTLLTDTNTDGVVDTGVVAESEKIDIVAKMAVPAGAVAGDQNSATVTAKSSLDSSRSKTVSAQAAVPTAFTQAFMDNSDGADSLYLVKTGGQAIKPQTEVYHFGYDSAVAETPNGNFILAWEQGRCLDSGCSVYVQEIEYTLTNKYGEAIQVKTRLTNHGNASSDVYDDDPSVAVAGDGKIGILWRREMYRYQTDHYERNLNVYFAILNPNGTVATAPVNLTNNTAWTVNTPGAPEFYNPVIAATNSTFVLAWMREQETPGCSDNDCWLDDIYSTVYNTGGSQVQGIVKRTADTTGANWEGYYYPNLAALNNNRVMLLWTRDSDYDNYFMVLDSAGATVKAATNLTGDGVGYTDSSADAAQLSDGKIAVAWTTWEDNANHSRFLILNSSYAVSAGPTTLESSAAEGGEINVSVAADGSGRAALTSLDDQDNSRLFYSLVSSTGSVITSPMVYHASGSTYPQTGFIDTGSSGYSNTTFKSTFATGVDAALLMSSIPAGGLPGGTATLKVQYTNHGQATAGGVSLTLTLPAGLTYLSDTSGVIPVPSGNLLTWYLPDLTFLDDAGFSVNFAIPAGTPSGTAFPVHLNLAATGESNPPDNVFDTNVVVVSQIYLPLTMH